MQWMTITSIVPCYAPHVPQHVAVSLFGPLNQNMISSGPSAETVFAYLVSKGNHTDVWMRLDVYKNLNNRLYRSILLDV